MTSLNHYALGAVANWLHTVVGGNPADSPGPPQRCGSRRSPAAV